VQRAKTAASTAADAKGTSGSSGYVPPAFVPQPQAPATAGGYVPPTPPQQASAPADAKAAAADPAAADTKEDGVFVAMHQYGAGTGKLWTTPLGNCIAIVAYEAPRRRAALTHYNTSGLFLDIFATIGSGVVGNEHLPTVTARLAAVKQALLRQLSGVNTDHVVYSVVLGLVWDTPTLVNKVGAVMWQALSAVFGVDQSDLAPLPVGLTAIFDAATGTLSWKQS
jgi:hypothetical protein